MIKKFLTILLLLIISPVFAANWIQFAPKAWYDASSYLKNGDSVKMWVKDLNPGDWDKVQNKKVWYYLREIEMSCSTHNYRLINNIAYDLKGYMIENLAPKQTQRKYDYGEGKFFTEENWLSVVPDTPSENIYKMMCK